MSRDQKFFDLYFLVIGGLAIFALVIFVLAQYLADRTQGVFTRESAEYQAAVEERIRPVGEVNLPGDVRQAAAPVVAAAPEPEPVAAAAMTGEQVYLAACTVCHGAGVGGAPITGNVEQWAARIAQGMDVLNDHAINGFDGDAPTPMLAKGGRADLSDQEVMDAVAYMVEQSQ